MQRSILRHDMMAGDGFADGFAHQASHLRLARLPRCASLLFCATVWPVAFLGDALPLVFIALPAFS